MPGPGSDLRVRLGLLLRQGPASLWPASANALYWLSSAKIAARKAAIRFKPDLIIANDWRSLPVAFAAKGAIGARIVYDSHEFAAEEFSDSWRWRLIARQHVVHIENRFIRAADAVMTVSDGISAALVARYGLSTPPTVISNMPIRQTMPFRPTEEAITVLYHGAVVPRRGLEALIESVSLWPARFRLVIRGPSQGQFDRHLQGLASGLGNRVTLEPAVAPEQIVAEASHADIGIFLLSDTTTHARFALPNKLFEYLSAGLMIVSSDLPEVRKIIDATEAGVLLRELSAQAIADAIVNLAPKQIDEHKRRSLLAAETFNFDETGARLLTLLDEVGGRT